MVRPPEAPADAEASPIEAPSSLSLSVGVSPNAGVSQSGTLEPPLAAAAGVARSMSAETSSEGESEAPGAL